MPDTGEFTIVQASVSIPNIETFLRELMVIASEGRVRIVCLDADKMAGKEHVEAAMRHAIRAFSNCSNIADSLEMEALLYAAGTRQCSIGVKFGVHVGNNKLFICIIPPSDHVETRLGRLVSFNDDNWEDINEQKMRRLMHLYSISQAELEAVGFDKFRDLVIERVALLEVNK